MIFGADIELTNRCNAVCDFCPRDQTPHTGLMSPETYEKTLERVLEFGALTAEALGRDDLPPARTNLCGLGEPLLNPNFADYVRQAREAGLDVIMSSNGALLNERRASALLEAGLQQIALNVGTTGEQYEEVYGLPFEKTLQNVIRFAEMAGDSCEVTIVLVDFLQDPEHIDRMRKFWIDHGISDFVRFEIMNRGGALFVDTMQYESMPESTAVRTMLEERNVTPYCGVPFGFLFVGYDGQHYLCCSDWKKEVPLGSVFDVSFKDVMADKLRHTLSRNPVCRTCNHDPLNRLTDALRGAGGEPDAAFNEILDEVTEFAPSYRRHLESIAPDLDFDAVEREVVPDRRRRIPVKAV